ncbi:MULTISPECIES: AraC family transcriptional regulator [Acinetobacter]|uniref:AraC family transcriptional regulator n=1 Tax=Acinetobacter junii TaxID=40215 RepID=A0AAW5R9Q1_ACIJU|nr:MULTISPECIES: AraC family transcriptional regulator [Acinetobacter]MCU4397463.1 AraC family transcriptional regulator [Acinetobacter junii]MDA3501925.1 AraC family transcriptional regulator [Acinetobacter sp. AOR34_HL]MDI9719353.1 AraC family transcriptional regulator ligand-binding domain-containing protein [Acinetobacter junii]QUS48638.1 AraC family transcriptional regulator ligand-binding domain-containing protein [Acinetobacter junii]RTE44974.1 AraC family transcriptional regulator [Aci
MLISRLPGTYVNLLIETIEEWGISSEEVLAETHITFEDLQKKYWYVDSDVFIQLLEKSVRLTGNAAFPILMANKMKVSHYGNVGIAAMSSKNLEQALRVLEEFIGLYCSVFKLRLEIEGEKAFLYLTHMLGESESTNKFIAFLVASFANIISKLIKTESDIFFLKQKQLFIDNNFAYKFEQVTDTVCFDRELLNIHLETADEIVFKLAKKQCIRDTDKHIKSRQTKSIIRSQIIELIKISLIQKNIGQLNLSEVAKQLNMSSRTLQRYLEIEDTTFKALIAEVKKQYAEAMLIKNELSIQEISESLAYADVSHFSRAFKNWTGVTPKAFRK